jgi:hypothetical protein
MSIARVLLPLTILAATRASAQQVGDTSHAYVWRDSVRYGEGPSVGAPPSDYTGAAPPAQWCLRATGPASGDLGSSKQSWTEVSQSWLRQVLSDTTVLGAGWRKVLGGAPQFTQSDTIVQVLDEAACHDIAETINHGLLGWKNGPPPVVVFQIRSYLVAYPSNARMGEFGLAVGMDLAHHIRGVSSW